MRIPSLLLSVPVCIAAALAAPSEAQAADGSIAGAVTDRVAKKKVPGAIVVLQCTCLEARQETTTDDRGMYVFRDLPVGVYTVQVLYGKADVSKTTTLQNGAKLRANFAIDPQNETRIKIDVPPVAVEPTPEQKQIIDIKHATKIPTGDGRDIEDAVLLNPAVAEGPEGPRVNGASGMENRWEVEGANVSDPTVGNLGASIVQEFLESVTVLESGYDAEFGNASSGQIQARRISGSNKVRGMARFTFTPRLARPRFILQTDEALRVTQVPNYAMQAVVTASGPLIKDKLWWSADRKSVV